MDVVKVFTEEPLGLEALVPDAEPDARRRDRALVSLESLLAPDARPNARAYIAGTALGPPHRIGATALADPGAWIRPLLRWAEGRDWTALGEDGSTRGLIAAEAAARLRRPDQTRALTVGPAPADALAEAASAAQRRDALPALQAILDAGAGVLFPEPAHDGQDWSVFAPAPLRDPLVEAFRAHPSGARRLVAPYQRARGEHKFYLEQWALDDLPDWVEEV